MRTAQNNIEYTATVRHGNERLHDDAVDRHPVRLRPLNPTRTHSPAGWHLDDRHGTPRRAPNRRCHRGDLTRDRLGRVVRAGRHAVGVEHHHTGHQTVGTVHQFGCGRAIHSPLPLRALSDLPQQPEQRRTVWPQLRELRDPLVDQTREVTGTAGAPHVELKPGAGHPKGEPARGTGAGAAHTAPPAATGDAVTPASGDAATKTVGAAGGNTPARPESAADTPSARPRSRPDARSSNLSSDSRRSDDWLTK